MADLNEVRLIGRLTRDPVVRMTPGGQQVASFGIATNRKYRGQDGVFREDPTFVDITCWGKLAEIVAKYTRKGKMVFIGGRLKYESWEDKQSGQKRSRLTVTAENVQFLDRRDDMPAEESYAPPAQGQGGNWQEPAATQSPPPPSPSEEAPPTWEEPRLDEPPF